MRQGRLEYAVSHAQVSMMEWADLRPTLTPTKGRQLYSHGELKSQGIRMVAWDGR